MDIQKIGQLIKTQRGALGLTQGALAQQVFGDAARKGDISRLEKARIKNPHQATLRKVFEALGLDLSILISPEHFDTFVSSNTPPAPLPKAIHEPQLIDMAKRVSPLCTTLDEAMIALENCVAMAEEVIADKEIYNPQSERQKHIRLQVARLASEGEGKEALHVIIKELDYVDNSQKRLAQNQMELLELAEAQAIALREWTKAATHSKRLLSLRYTDPSARAEALYQAWSEEFPQILTTKEASALTYWNHLFDDPELPNTPTLTYARAQTTLERAHHTGKSDDYLAAAQAYDTALGLMSFEDTASTSTAYHARAVALRQAGSLRGDVDLLHRALDGFQAALDLRNRSTDPTGWASTQNALGMTWQALGEKEQSHPRLERALAAYGHALEIRTQADHPHDWATTQSNIGTAYRYLAEITDGETYAAKAVDAFRASLTERSPERAPHDWATTQNNLGGALATLGEMRRDISLLDEAVSAFRGALNIFTRETAPFDWARTRINVAIALRSKFLFAGRSEDRLMAQQALSGVEGELIERDAKSTLTLYYQVAAQIAQL